MQQKSNRVLTAVNANIDDPAEMDLFRAEDLKRARRRAKDEIKRLRQRGILDSQGRRIRGMPPEANPKALGSPRMIIIAGAPASGKSTLFPLSEERVEFFDASVRAILPPEVQRLLGLEFERFVCKHIAENKSFAIQTGLHLSITFRQVEEAQRRGFKVMMRYVGLRDVRQNIERAFIRRDDGRLILRSPTANPKATLRKHYHRSLRNLPKALATMDYVVIYDNSGVATPEAVLATLRGSIVL